jgi:hypothetical protein
LREHVLGHVPRLVVKPEGVVPLVQLVVIAHAQAFAANGVGKIT